MSRITAIAILLAALAAQNPTAKPIVRQVDHIILGSKEPKRLFDMFVGKLQLPIAWPMRSYGSFVSGGVGIGPIALEIYAVTNGAEGFSRVALQPDELKVALPELDARGIAYDKPRPVEQPGPGGVSRLAWTIVDLPQLPPASAIFACKYATDVDERHRQSVEQLKKAGGGPLGVASPAEVVLNVADLPDAERQWSKLTAQETSHDGLCRLPAGPAIRLVAAKESRVAILRIKVKTLATAREFLKEEHMLGIDTPNEISIDPKLTSGADIRFIE